MNVASQPLLDMQEQFISAQADIVAFCGGPRIGKTVALLRSGLMTCHRIGCTGLILTNQPAALLRQAARLYDDLQTVNRSWYDVKMNPLQLALTWPHYQSKLLFADGRNWDRLRGLRPQFVGIDNLDHFSMNDMLLAYEQLRPGGTLRVTFDSASHTSAAASQEQKLVYGISEEGKLTFDFDSVPWPTAFFNPWFLESQPKFPEGPVPLGEVCYLQPDIPDLYNAWVGRDRTAPAGAISATVIGEL